MRIAVRLLAVAALAVLFAAMVYVVQTVNEELPSYEAPRSVP